MAKADDSKGKTLTAAVKLFRQQGYHGTALHDILAAGGAPRGSLYFHFPKGKEEIGAGALSLAGEAVRQAIVQAAEKSEILAGRELVVESEAKEKWRFETEVFSNGYKIFQFLKRPIPSNAKN